MFFKGIWKNNYSDSIEDFETSQIDDFAIRLRRIYKVSNHLKTIDVIADVKSQFGKLQLVESERSNINIKNSIESNNLQEVLIDFDKKTKEVLKQYVWSELVSDFMLEDSKTLDELIILDFKSD